MAGGRPRKPSALRALEGNRSLTPIPKEPNLRKCDGIPPCPDQLTGRAREHFEFVARELCGCGVIVRLDVDALALMASLWGMYWQASDDGDYSNACKLSARWFAMAGRFGMTPADRAKVMAGPSEADPTEDRFFKVTG